QMFNRAVLGETPAEEEEQIRGRIIEVTVHDLTGDFGKMHIKVQFRVETIRGSEVTTRYVGHDMTSDYIRRLTRRKRSRIDGTFDVKTKDGAVLRVKPMAITDRRIQNSKQAAIRKVMHRVVYERASKTPLADFVQAMIVGDLAKEIATACKAIQPIFRVEIRKSELLRSPSVEAPEEAMAEVPEEQPPEEPPAEEPELEEPAPAS
ncbi:MAG: 30S ribosomal protein S3ae, partial [Thermoplasmata archaeon]